MRKVITSEAVPFDSDPVKNDGRIQEFIALLECGHTVRTKMKNQPNKRLRTCPTEVYCFDCEGPRSATYEGHLDHLAVPYFPGTPGRYPISTADLITVEPGPRTATIESLPSVAWNAHAALGDAMNRAPLTSPVIALWLDENGQVRWSASATNQQIVWMLHTQLKRL